MFHDMSFGFLVACSTLAGISYLFIRTFYRLFVHPLSKYPGPLAAKLSGLFGVFYAYKTNLHVRTLEDHDKYGSVVRHGPNKLVFNTVEALRDIYKNDQVTKSQSYLASQRKPGVFNLFNAVDPQLHHQKRKLAGRFLNRRSIDVFEPVMIQQIDTFIDQLAAHSASPEKEPVNMTPQTKYLAIDIMGQLLFEYPLNLQTESTHRHMSYSRASFAFNVAFQIHSIAKLGISNIQSAWSIFSRKNYVHTLAKIIRSRLAQGKHIKEDLRFLSANMTTPEDDQEWINDAQTEALWHMLAGSDTTSTLLSALTFYLSRNPRCYERLSQEIRSTFSQDSEIRSGPLLASCVYLRACLEETLRITPPLPGTLWREESPRPSTEPLIVDGHVIPAGVEVGVNTYAIMHNDKYFREPFVFKPERWLEGAEPGECNREAFAPFSLGIRGCLGKSMAYLEASLTTAKMLWHFDFKEAPRTPGTAMKVDGHPGGRPGVFHVADSFAALHDGPYLHFSRVAL
ncbi:cytochrome P450 [Stachybotrys elegans]|uniref:Cytochrome P450 n=1 Tax=Stachybotrys elegans TaxID=80388 RepID=A0A8K0WKL4_9HYPO|nr:cytochrome P450 [Stachybotrys elegans]